MSLAYLNGSFSRLDLVHISPLDRGFLFGDGVYEVIPCYQCTLFRIERHLQRLERSLAAIRIENPHPATTWEAVLGELVRKKRRWRSAPVSAGDTGVAPRDHAFPNRSLPCLR